MVNNNTTMKQTSTTYPARIAAMVQQFESIEPSTARISTEQMSIHIEQPCGCNLTEHFNCPTEDLQKRYYVELCDEHKLQL